MTPEQHYQEFVDISHLMLGEYGIDGPNAIAFGFKTLIGSAPSVQHGVAVFKAVVADMSRSGIKTSMQLSDELGFEAFALATGNRGKAIHDAFAHSSLPISQAIEQRTNRETRYMPTLTA